MPCWDWDRMARRDGDRMAYRDAPAPCNAQALPMCCLHGQGRAQAHWQEGREMRCPVSGQWRETAQRDTVAWHGTLTWYSTVPWHGAVSWHSAVSWHGAVAWHGGVTWHSSGTYCVVLSWLGSDAALCGHRGRGRELAQRGELPWQSQLAQRDGRVRCKANICVCARACAVCRLPVRPCVAT